MSSIPELQAKIKLARERFQRRPDSRDFAPLADLLREAGQFREALLILDKGLRKYPRYVTGQVIKGRTLIEAGYEDLGRAALKKALELDSCNLLALDLLIGEATGRKAWSEVLAPLEKLVALEPEDEKLVIFLSKVRQKLLEDEPKTPVHQDYRNVVAEPVVESDPQPPVIVEPVKPVTPAPVAPAMAQPVVDDDDEPVLPAPSPVPGASHITMTMVDIYLAQGYREMAITALEEILEANPGRQDVQDKLDSLKDDPNCGIPESRKETKMDSVNPSSSKQALIEQRLRDKAQFTRWIEGVNDNTSETNSEGTP